MKPKTTAVLGVVFFLLCGAYFGALWFESYWRQRAVQQKKVFSFEAGDFRKISIQQEKQRPVVASKDATGTWHIEAPYPLDAYQEIWNRIAAHLAELSTERLLEENPKEVSHYELDVPRLTVEAETFEGAKLKITFGMPGPTRKNRYAQVNDTAILLVREDAFFELNRGLDLLREFRLFPQKDKPIRRLEFARYWQGNEPNASQTGIEKGKESVVVAVERDSDESWVLREPVTAPADNESVSRLVQRLQTDVCKDFVDEPKPLADYGLDPPQARITLFVEDDDKPTTIYFGATAKEGKDSRIFAKHADKPAVFTVAKDIEKLFPASPTAFRARRLVTRKASEITSIRFVAGNESFFLVKDDQKGWVLSEPSVQETDQAAVSSFIAQLMDIEATTFLDRVPSDAGLDAPRGRLTLQYKGAQTPVEVRIGNAADDKNASYATQDTGSVVTIPVTAAENLLQASAFMFVGKYLLQFKTEEAVHVSLRFEGVDYEFEKAATVWRVVKPSGKVWESQSAMAALLDALHSVRATGIASVQQPSDLAPYGLDAPILTVEVTLSSGKAPSGQKLSYLRVGALAKDENDRYRYALCGNRPELFFVKQDLIDDIREALRAVKDE